MWSVPKRYPWRYLIAPKRGLMLLAFWNIIHIIIIEWKKTCKKSPEHSISEHDFIIVNCSTSSSQALADSSLWGFLPLNTHKTTQSVLMPSFECRLQLVVEIASQDPGKGRQKKQAHHGHHFWLILLTVIHNAFKYISADFNLKPMGPSEPNTKNRKINCKLSFCEKCWKNRFLPISPALFASTSIVIGSKSEKSNATPEEWGIFVDMSKVLNFKPYFQVFKRMIPKYVKKVWAKCIPDLFTELRSLFGRSGVTIT